MSGFPLERGHQGRYRASRRTALAGVALSPAKPRLVRSALPKESTAPDTIFLGPTVRTMDLGQSALKHSVRFSLHSGSDVTEIGPLHCIENAVTRIMQDGVAAPGPEQRFPVGQALRATTIDAADQAHVDHAIGTLEVGKYADLVVLGEDPMKVDPMRLGQIGVRETWVEGVKPFG